MFGAIDREIRACPWIPVVCSLTITVLTCGLLAEAIPNIVASTIKTPPYDLIVDYQPAHAIREGYDPYTSEGLRRSGAYRLGDEAFGHFPTSSFWILPLAGTDLRQANIAWCWITVLTMLFETVLLMNALGCPAPNATGCLVFSYFLASPAALYHLTVGQFSQAIGLLFFLAWFELRKGREVTAGVSLGAACSMKAFPGILLLYLLITRRYRALAAAIATDLAITAFMLGQLGLRSWTEFLGRRHSAADLWVPSMQNLSLHGIVARWFFPACGGPGRLLPVATALSGVLALAIITAFGWWTRRLAREPRGFDLTFAGFVMVSVFTSQWAWEHYKLIYVFPLAVLASELVGIVRRRRARGLAALAASAILLAAIEMQVSPWIKNDLRDALHPGVQSAHLPMHLLEVLNWAPTALLVLTFGLLLFDRVRECAVPAPL